MCSANVSGEAFVEPPNVKMSGDSRSPKEALRVIIFYVIDPGTPFLDQVCWRRPKIDPPLRVVPIQI